MPRSIAVDLTASGFTPQVPLRLVRLAYEHVRPGDDVRHEGSYSPDTRDHAQEGRNAVLSAIIAAKGIEGWNATREGMAALLRDRLDDIDDLVWQLLTS